MDYKLIDNILIFIGKFTHNHVYQEDFEIMITFYIM